MIACARGIEYEITSLCVTRKNVQYDSYSIFNDTIRMNKFLTGNWHTNNYYPPVAFSSSVDMDNEPAGREKISKVNIISKRISSSDAYIVIACLFCKDISE